MRTAATCQNGNCQAAVFFGLLPLMPLPVRGLYTFDMRKLSAATYRHWDHVMAVLDVDYAPNGTLARNFVVSVDKKKIFHGTAGGALYAIFTTFGNISRSRL